MAKILLIKCNEYVYPYGITHPLGVMYLSSYLKREGGHDVRIIETRTGNRLGPDAVREVAAQWRPDIIGLSALLIESRNFHDTAEALRKDFPETPIFAGGPYPSSCPDRVLLDNNITCAVTGEGEATMLQLVEALEHGNNFSDISGTAVRENGGFRISPPGPGIENLDTLPFPDWDAINPPAYFGCRRFSNQKPGPFMTIFTSRSCPFNCIYCHKIFGKKFRSRSVENVLEEIETVVNRYGITEFEVVDDTFTMNRDRAAEIFDGIVAMDRKISILFPNGVRADMLDEELVRKMKAAGTRYVAVAVETASPRLQKLVRKNLDLERTREAIKWITRAGIFCNGFFMLGFPTETEQEMKASVDYACHSRLHTASFFIVTPAPGTELHDMISKNAPDAPEFSSFSYHSLSITASELPREKIKKLYRSGFRRFYMNPARILRIFFAFPEKWFLFQSMLHGLHRMILNIDSYTKSSSR